MTKKINLVGLNPFKKKLKYPELSHLFRPGKYIACTESAFTVAVLPIVYMIETEVELSGVLSPANSVLYTDFS